MKYESVWKTYKDNDVKAVEAFSQDYRTFLTACKTERECAAWAVKIAEEKGYTCLDSLIAQGKKLKAGDKVWAHVHGKALVLVHLGTEDLETGLNILGAHIDSPRLDIKQNPLYEANDFAFLDTHYYGGIKHYQWVTTPLAIHGVVVKKTGETIEVVVGENDDDPVFCVTDLLVHLASEQMEKTGKKIVEGENLDVLVGSRPLVFEADDLEDEKSESKTEDSSLAAQLKKLAKKEPVKAMLLKLLEEKYDIEEKDFLSAELEVVPAGAARDCGFDRSMIIGYGQDDRVCSYASLRALLDLENPKKTAVCVLVDKEEIGSVGATGMTSRFFENTIAEIMELAGSNSGIALRRSLAASNMLSCDVGAGFDPLYPSVFESKNSGYLGYGLVLKKFTGSRGKSGSNDASAEYLAKIREIFDSNKVAFYSAELGKVDAGGGGTIAYVLAEYGMNVVDAGVAVLSMHSPWEVSSKADIYEAYKGYKAFLLDA